MDPFIGEIRMFGFNYVPEGWAVCNGQLIPISQNPALFALLGTTFGGDGMNTFALPDLQGRVPLHLGKTNYPLGEKGGSTTVTLGQQNHPPHSHPLNGTTAAASTGKPGAQLLAQPTQAIYTKTDQPQVQSYPLVCVSQVGGGQPHNNLQPSLVANFCIALTGVFPEHP
jgi:microcystin-dependent protein